MYRFLCYLVLFTTTLAQAQQGLPDLKKLDTYTIEPEFTSHAAPLLPFNSIRVSDQRFDTTKVGYIRTGKQFKKAQFRGPAGSTIETALNKAFANRLDKSTNQTLWIFLKHYFLQETTVSEQKGYKITMQTDESNKQFYICHVTFETYLEKDAAFTPLFRIDTLFTTNHSHDKNIRELTSLPFDYCMERVANTDIAKFQSSRKFLSAATVEQYYRSRKSSPRLQKETLEKGIYLTFQDFLTNKVSPLDYELTKNYLSDQVYIKQNGQTVLITDYWGICDGVKDYINIGLNIYELVRTNNTYELWGSKAATHDFKSPARRTATHLGPVPMANTPLIGILSQRDRINENLKPLQLNMETGKVY